jgi:hypothetical protein
MKSSSALEETPAAATQSKPSAPLAAGEGRGCSSAGTASLLSGIDNRKSVADGSVVPEGHSRDHSAADDSLALVPYASRDQQTAGPTKPLWSKREIVKQERVVQYTTVDDQGTIQELCERDVTQTEVGCMSVRTTVSSFCIKFLGTHSPLSYVVCSDDCYDESLDFAHGVPRYG